MSNPISFSKDHAARTLNRLCPRLETRFDVYAKAHPNQWAEFLDRMESQFEPLFEILLQLYGTRYDFFFYLEELLYAMAQSWVDRSSELKKLDHLRIKNPDWFQDNHMLGGVCYVDLFAGNLAGITDNIPYFKEIGLTFLHLMPLFCTPESENDGGYAISSYRQLDPAIGTMKQLSSLARKLRRQGISLVLDFVFNHTSDEHEWAKRARSGDPVFKEYYWIFPDRILPDAYEKNLREIFPHEHSGAFTYHPDLDGWVWTTFHAYQWDLNYQNQAVFNAITQEMLFLANLGVEVLRLDAVAFTWKQLGTNCENLPQAHKLIEAFNYIARISAPGLLFLSEAIVHPDEVARYIRPYECQLSYNPLLMALLWEALATRNVSLLAASMRDRFQIPQACAWVNYVRCHDDIGWTFSDEDAGMLGINAYDHRQFLNAFYTGRFPGSFGRGLPFQENLKTGDCRISGTCASLAGLEKAIIEEPPLEVDLAIRRILLIHGIIMTIGGIPLIYFGDEIGTLNDYSFQNDVEKADDSRWVHRPKYDWVKADKRKDEKSLESRVFMGLMNLIKVRQSNPAFTGNEFQLIDNGNPHVFSFLRINQQERVMVFANFSETPQTIPANILRLYGLGYQFKDLVNGEEYKDIDLTLEGYQLACIINIS